jgi:hypothetical protein
MQSASESISNGVSSAIHDTATAVVTGAMTSASAAWKNEPSVPIDSDRIIDKIGRMVEKSEQEEGSYIDDITPEERARQEELPRNPKKRMFEAEVEEPVRDEL